MCGTVTHGLSTCVCEEILCVQECTSTQKFVKQQKISSGTSTIHQKHLANLVDFDDSKLITGVSELTGMSCICCLHFFLVAVGGVKALYVMDALKATKSSLQKAADFRQQRLYGNSHLRESCK